MRDPERIKPFLEEVGNIWRKHCSDWRFGQFLNNALCEMISKHGDMFFWEEDKFLEYLKEYFENSEKA